MGTSNPIIHIIVVGFHHKKGCQLEYAYPPLKDDDSNSNECPSGWKYLPTLALPDGSHNYTHDTVYFHVPSLKNPRQTVFGISCYRQIPINKVKNRTPDMTRDTVQKAVCVLSVVPLYGHIEVKMSLITQAYFEEGDFTKVSLLQNTFDNLNICLSNMGEITITQNFFVGLSAREFILRYRHRALLLFKLMLLERKIIFHCSPVNDLCSTILTLLSLLPGMLEYGLHQSACFQPSRPMSPVPQFHQEIQSDEENMATVQASNPENITLPPNSDISCSSNFNVSFTRNSPSGIPNDCTLEMYTLDGSGENEPNGSVNNSDDIVKINTNLSVISQLDLVTCGMPLSIFQQGYLCLPYLSLPYMDILTDQNIRGYVIGSTNVLFKQKKQLSDVLIGIDANRIETNDKELEKQLGLSKEDRRFADSIVKSVCEEKHSLQDGVMWEGGDEWIRMQFKIYLFSILRTSLLPDDSRQLESFNADFLAAWKTTNNYKIWAASYSHTITDLMPCHPSSGQLTIADFKLKLTQSIQYTEGGKKLNQAVVNTRIAVGGAITQAKGAVSSWITNLTNSSTNRNSLPEKINVENTAESKDENVSDSIK